MVVYPCDGWHWCITQERLQWDHCSLSLRVVMWIQRVNAYQLICISDVEHQLTEVLKLWFLSHSDSFDHDTCGSNRHNCILDIPSKHYNFVFNIWNKTLNPQFLKIQVILVSFLLSQPPFSKQRRESFYDFVSSGWHHYCHITTSNMIHSYLLGDIPDIIIFFLYLINVFQNMKSIWVFFPVFWNITLTKASSLIHKEVTSF